jgi:predicted DNA-binding antitoxin AbrB/MazE fold protein
MAYPVRAIYSQGQLRLLDPVDLTEGQEIQFMILSEIERVRLALADLLVEIQLPPEVFDEDTLLREIEEAFKNQPPLSQTIIDERQEGP